MKHLQFGHKPVFLAIIIFFNSSGISQTIKIFKDSVSLTAFVIRKGDSVVNKLDSSIIMNKNTYNAFQKYYERGQDVEAYVNELSKAYDAIVHHQDTMLKIKEEFYKALNKEFDSLANRTDTFLNITGKSVDAASSSLNIATTQLNSAQESLKKAKEKLDQERLRRSAKAIKFGLGGLVIGALIAAVIFAN